jgi:RHS repeat-associated protein
MQVPGALDLSYVYPAAGSNNGRISAETNNLTSTQVSYTYDQLNRLATATSVTGGNTNWGLGFSYDVYGNRTAQTVTAGSAPAFSATFGSNNRMVGYSYDNNGNQLNTADGATLEYDEENRLKKWTKQGQVQEYAYHPAGWRLWNSNEGWYLYGPGGQLLTKSGTLSTDYVYFAGRLLFTMSEGSFDPRLTKLTRMYSDRLGSTRATAVLTYGGGSTTRNYYPFGEEITSTANNEYKFASTYRDSATGLDYAINRYYASGTARFLTPDPYQASGGPASPQSWNRYAYVVNDPVNHLDPTGLFYSTAQLLNSFGYGAGGGGGGWGWGGGGSDGEEVVGPVPELPPEGGGGGRLDTGPILSRAQTMISKSKCGDWLVSVAQDAFMSVSGKATPEDLDPLSRTYYDAITSGNIMGRLQAAAITDTGRGEKDQYGNDLVARANYGDDGTNQSVQLFNPFFSKSLDEQAQTMLHEGLHLIFALGDADLARAAGVYKKDATASSDFSNEVKKNCN